MRSKLLIAVLAAFTLGLLPLSASPFESETEPPLFAAPEQQDNVCKGGTCGIRRIDGTWDKFECPTSGNLVCGNGQVCRCVCTPTPSGTVNTTNTCVNANQIPPLAEAGPEDSTPEAP